MGVAAAVHPVELVAEAGVGLRDVQGFAIVEDGRAYVTTGAGSAADPDDCRNNALYALGSIDRFTGPATEVVALYQRRLLNRDHEALDCSLNATIDFGGQLLFRDGFER